MMIYSLINNPTIKQKVVNEINLNVKEQQLTYESLKKLTYL